MTQTNAYTLEQYEGKKVRNGLTWRRLQLGYTYQALNEVTGIKPNRIIKLIGLNASARPKEVKALAHALLLAEHDIKEWLICTSEPH